MKIDLNKGAVSYNLKFKDMFSSVWPKFYDRSAIMILISNIIIIFMSLFGKISISEIIWLYWAQSSIIGLFIFIKIRSLKKFRTDNLLVNGKVMKPDEHTKKYISLFFAFHFGMFHFVYLVFLITLLNVNLLSFFIILGGSLLFLFTHYYSFKFNYEKDKNANKNIGTIMFQPYARILPMHFFIIIGAVLSKGIVLFLILKTLVDFFMHNSEHNSNNHMIKN